MAIEPHKFVTQLASKLVKDEPTPEGVLPEQPADRLAKAAEVQGLASFAGYLGGIVKDDWRLLYLDSRLETWLLVRDQDILYHQSIEDDTAPLKKRDVIWTSADASIGRGSGPQSVESRFLTGQFTKAGDFETAPSGGTMAAATGVFCEARTPFCCYRRSR